jgi:hypothetical protein
MNDAQETDRVGTLSRENNRKLGGAFHKKRELIFIQSTEAMGALLQMFCNSSGLTFHGGSFNNVGGDMSIYNASPEDCT